MLSFEWDEQKARRNLLKHGVSFDEAKVVFSDTNMADVLDERFDYGEERWIATGQSGHRILTVAYVDRGHAIRIVSARQATRLEINDYTANAADRGRAGRFIGNTDDG